MREWSRRLWEGWKEIAGYIGDFQARLLLTLFYFTLAVPFGLLARIVADPLRMRRSPASSSWSRRETRETDLEAMQRQF